MVLDDTIDPEKMSLLEKKTLKEVFQIIPVLRSTMDNAFKRLKAMA
jgi:signal-transduction protein with cAMP-binding, CBS, and nucleotidyltransferase domain